MATTAEIQAQLAILKEECLQFNMLELPGQPRMMHMGTSSLVNRLESALRSAVARIEELEST